ncbi:hypothetical protein LJK88_48955 [Paenibacillus sp. P26]|nr:hypothetical protein LJK88_48955 [Paenibacillus sp. P26]
MKRSAWHLSVILLAAVLILGAARPGFADERAAAYEGEASLLSGQFKSGTIVIWS